MTSAVMLGKRARSPSEIVEIVTPYAVSRPRTWGHP